MKIFRLVLFICFGTVVGSIQSFAQEIETDPVGQYIDSLRITRQQLSQIQHLKFSGYAQMQYQVIDTAGAGSYGGGNFPANVDNRFSIRRGRLKMTYADSLAQYVLQFDGTERGVAIRDAYVRITDPKFHIFNLTMGVFDRPFGYEISYSSRLRESPERGRMSQILFPNERDLGAMASIDYTNKQEKRQLKLDMGFFNGTGFVINDIDSKKDFIGRLSYRNERSKRFRYGAGVSWYYGSLMNASEKVFEMSGTRFVMDSAVSNLNHTERRIYGGANVQMNFFTSIGFSIIRAEYIQGQQPGTQLTSASPTAIPIPGTATYVRRFNGAYLYLVQNIMRTRHQLVFKYDWYDPNTHVKGKDIGAAGSNTGPADIRYDTWGFGYIFRATDNIRVMAYYDLVRNEKTQVAGTTGTNDYRRDLKDDLVTLRLQYRF